jgi:hypothetical protein
MKFIDGGKIFDPEPTGILAGGNQGVQNRSVQVLPSVVVRYAAGRCVS